jgi:uncharacterized SAM-binding protein YcdF (DUF218 family)
MTLAGLATPFVVPPMNLAVLAALLLLAGRRRLAGLALALLLALGLPVVADGLMAGLMHGYGAGDPAGAQAIVVLGAEVELQSDGRTLPGLLSLDRLRAAAALARNSGLPVLVSGGLTQPGAAAVAVAMADSLRRDFATPARWVEDRSANTFANARDSAALLAQAGVSRVLLVTHQWHMRRALLAFAGTSVRAIPAPVPIALNHGVAAADFIPRVGAWQTSYYALHEWIGLAWYTLRARL